MTSQSPSEEVTVSVALSDIAALQAARPKTQADVEADDLWDKAAFCIQLRIAPSEYDRMTYEEIATFTEVYNYLNEE